MTDCSCTQIGRRAFVVNSDCPLHGENARIKRTITGRIPSTPEVQRFPVKVSLPAPDSEQVRRSKELLQSIDLRPVEGLIFESSLGSLIGIGFVDSANTPDEDSDGAPLIVLTDGDKNE